MTDTPAYTLESLTADLVRAKAEPVTDLTASELQYITDAAIRDALIGDNDSPDCPDVPAALPICDEVLAVAREAAQAVGYSAEQAAAAALGAWEALKAVHSRWPLWRGES